VKKGREYDLVVVDAPATGHGVGFLQTPRTFAGIARMGPIHNQAQALDRFITDHENTGAVIVSLPEEMPVNESASLENQLRDEVGVEVERVYMNAMYPERFSDEESRRLERVLEITEGPAHAAVRAAVSQHRRADAQRAQLDRLASSVNAPISTLPFIFEPRLGVDELRRLAGALS
jgi:anion-transporting  ArsA/GET3 family ATPase